MGDGGCGLCFAAPSPIGHPHPIRIIAAVTEENEKEDATDCSLTQSDGDRIADTNGQKWTRFGSGGSIGGL